MQQAEINYYPSLTGIRAVAAWMVFVHHFNFFKEQFVGTSVYHFFSEFHIGVTVFFVLSGLLITLRYYDKTPDGGFSFYDYMVKRFARIYPSFFLILTINFIWLLCTDVYQNNADAWLYFAGAATLVRGFFAHFAGGLVPQSWSLTVEECFYISAPFIFILLRRNMKNMILIPFGLVATGLIITAVFIQYPFHGFFEDHRFLFNFTFFGRCAEFFAGIGVAVLYKKRLPQKSGSLKFTLTGIAVMIACVAGLASFHNGDIYGDHHPVGILINNLFLPLFGIAVLFWGLLTEANFVVKFLSSKPMILFGKSSYIFYLIHLGIFATVFYGSVARNPLLVFIFLNAVSILLYFGFEKPVNAWLRKKLLQRPTPSTSKN